MKHLIGATRHSFSGLKAAFNSEWAFRFELFLTIWIIPLAFILGDSILAKLLMLFAWGLVLFAELVNTAIEALCDRFGDEFHELSKIAKDTGSACVFISCVLCAMVWLGIIFL